MPIKRSVQAEDIVRDLKQETDKVVYTLRDAQIEGKLDLKHHTIDLAIDIQDCKFLDEVDLRYSEFTKAVNFSNCTFRKSFNSGDETESHTVYRKDLICNRAVFEGAVSFNGCQVGSSAYFMGATFADAEEIVDFATTFFEKTVKYNQAMFKGSVSFASLRCGGSGYFNGAKFEGEGGVDFAHASFGTNLYCHGNDTVFKGPVNFGSLKCGGDGIFNEAKFESQKGVVFVQASFEGTFQCIETTFKGPVDFMALKCGLTGNFTNTQFEGEDEVDFSHASFSRDLVCNDTTFNGSASFNLLRCSNLLCDRATFKALKAQVNFNTLKCGGGGFFRGATFLGKQGVTFSFASFGGNFECQGATFQGIANFNSLRCGGSGFFTGSRFEGEGGINLGHASFDVNLYCNGKETTFRGPADFGFVRCSVLNCSEATFQKSVNFRSLKCNGGLFRSTQFQGKEEVSFDHASLAMNLECDDSLFQVPVSFNTLTCGGSGFFEGAKFRSETETDFNSASFGGDLVCSGATFNSGASFNRLECGGSGQFEGARFCSTKEVNLALTRFGTTLRLANAEFAGSVDLQGARISQALTLDDSRFQTEVTLYGTVARVLVLEGSSFPFRESALDLRGCTFERFQGSEQQAMKLAGAQDPTKFSRDPYLQLERYYDSIGNDAQAREVHYQGRLALRKNAKKENSSTEWTWGKSASDLFVKVLTRYGVSTNRVVVVIFAFLIVGGILFSLDAISPLPEALVVRPSATSTASTPPTPTVADRIAYDLDQFVPVVSMQIKQKWEPGNQWYQAYAVLHALAGWLLIPLFLASWSGLVRSR